ncbi:MAG: 4Fe-4S dicluster domain-containing protein [Planctomycetota bacterium]
MAQIPPLLMVEPAAGQRRAAGIVARKESPLDLESIKTELGEIRRHCRDNETSLMEEYKKNLAQFEGVEWTVAPDAAQAASYVKQVAGPADLVSINKSTVVVNELRPQLQAAGLKTYVRYFKEFDRFEKKIEDYWGLPGLHEKGLVESFDVARTFTHLRSGQVRDYVAVVGVNAVSAGDGSVFFLQHMSNISRDLQQAKKIVMVVSPEKVVKDRAAALLQTRSMGVFGLESILLDLGPKEVEKYDFEGLPTIARDRELHVLILDNGRTEIFADQYRDLFLCIDCRACARQCPIGRHMDVEGMSWTPKNYLLGFLQGSVDNTEACLHCGRCHVECPVDIDIPSLIWRARFEHYAEHGRSWKKQLMDGPELLAKMGSMTAPLSNWASSLSVCKLVMEAVVGVHRDAPLPTFHRRTFKKWVSRRD